MKSTKKHFILETGEYVVDANHPDTEFYEVKLKGKILKDVIGIIRDTRYKDE